MRPRGWMALAMLSLAAEPLAAQQPCDTCGLVERGDRVEGIEDREQISGGSFELMSVHYLAARKASAAGAEVRVFFWSHEAGVVDEFKVWQPARYYRMEPLRRDFGAGLSEFSWKRADVIDPMQLATESLYTRVRSGETFLPAQLTTGSAPAPHEGYAFVFRSGAGIDADCTIVRPADGASVKSFECFSEYGGAITIEWDGLDDTGKPADDGVYRLEVDGEMLAETVRPLVTGVDFRHRAKLQ